MTLSIKIRQKPSNQSKTLVTLLSTLIILSCDWRALVTGLRILLDYTVRHFCFRMYFVFGNLKAACMQASKPDMAHITSYKNVISVERLVLFLLLLACFAV